MNRHAFDLILGKLGFYIFLGVDIPTPSQNEKRRSQNGNDRLAEVAAVLYGVHFSADLNLATVSAVK